MPIFANGSLQVELYAPKGHDPQQPHQRDEAYLVAWGSGLFFNGVDRVPVEAGSFLFVAAGQVHRFEDFSADFVVWVFFYGPAGGEATDRPGVVEDATVETTLDLTIRPFEPADSLSLEALWGRVFADDPPSNAPAVMIANKLRVQPELLLVCLRDATLVGAVMAGFDGVRGWIYHLAVAPEARRRGIGTRLVRAAESGLRTLGCPKVNLQVRASNAGVVAFYQTLGYVIEERISLGRRLGDAG